jgi:hypothetical protein
VGFCDVDTQMPAALIVAPPSLEMVPPHEAV